jgi:hypothetical protein
MCCPNPGSKSILSRISIEISKSKVIYSSSSSLAGFALPVFLTLGRFPDLTFAFALALGTEARFGDAFGDAFGGTTALMFLPSQGSG